MSIEKCSKCGESFEIGLHNHVCISCYAKNVHESINTALKYKKQMETEKLIKQLEENIAEATRKLNELKQPKFKDGDWLYSGFDGNTFLCKFYDYDRKSDRIKHHCSFEILGTDEHVHEKTAGIYNACIRDSSSIATPEQILSVLTKVAKHKGYNAKSIYKYASLFNPKQDLSKEDFGFQGGCLILNGIQIYDLLENQWAEIIKQEKFAGYDLEIHKDFVKIGCKTFTTQDLISIKNVINLLNDVEEINFIDADGVNMVRGNIISYKELNDLINRL